MAKETAQVDIQLSNGKKAGNTINELTASSVKLNREIKNLKPGSEKFIKKTEEFQKVNKRLREVRGQVNGVKKANQSLISSFTQLLPFNAQFSTFGNTIGAVKTGVGGLSKGFRVLKLAVIAVPLFALIAIITALVIWFKKFQKGIEVMDKILAALNATFDVIIDRASMLIESIKLFFSDGIMAGLRGLKDTFTGIGEEIAKDAALAMKLSDALHRLEEEENAFFVTQSDREKQIQKLIFLTRMETVSFEERMQALKDANELEEANMNDALRFQKERVRIATEDDERAKSTVVEHKKLQDEQIKLNKLETASLARQRELLNRVNELNTKWNIVKVKQAAAAQKEAEFQEMWAVRDIEISGQKQGLHEIVIEHKNIEIRKTEEQKEKEIELEKRKSAIIKQILIEEADLRDRALMGTLATSSFVFGRLASLYQRGSEEYKALAILQGMSDTIASSIAAYKSTAAIPIVGPALAPIAAAAAAAFGLAKVNQIRKMKYKGGIGSIGSFSGGTPRNRSAIPSLNISGPQNPLAPSTQNQPGAPSITVNVGQDPVVNELAGLREDLKSGVITVNNNLQEVDAGLKTLNNLVQERQF